jgi:serine/threonine-protein kinase
MDVGIEFSHYRVIEHIGRGGMADVWSARDKRLSRTVAIKTVARDLSQDMNPVKLFEREAQTIAALEHPHILPIYEFGDYDGQLYIVMRYVSGGSLEDVLEKGPLSVDETLRVARAVGQALDYAHTNKVIHLDLKPSNILLDSYQSPYLADFGLATMVDPEGRAKNPGNGTLLYMAPEQMTADLLDSHADIYSFAILLYHMLTGQLPFDGAMPLAIKQLQGGEQMPDVRGVRPSLPPTVNDVLRQASELELTRRVHSIHDVIDALDYVLGGRRIISMDTAVTPSEYGETLETKGITTLPLDQIISGPIDGFISRTIAKSPTSEPTTGSLDELITGPIENLISKTGEIDTRSLSELDSSRNDALISKPLPVTGTLDELITGPIENLISKTGELKQAAAVVTEDAAPIETPLITLSPEALAKREAEDIYNRARRAYGRGQGRFILGVTDYILIADYCAQAETNGFELDDSGTQMLLRGALEYDYEIDRWWAKCDDESRRWTALHALRSENAPARARALERLENLPDSDPPQIPRLVAQALQVETHKAAQLAAIRVLALRSPLPARERPWYDRLGLWSANDWRPVAYNVDIDGLLAEQALSEDEPDTAISAARAVGTLRSDVAVNAIADARRKGEKGAFKALAYARDEANSLPPSVGLSNRLGAWLTNTWRRLSENPLHTVWRFALVLMFSTLGLGLYIYLAKRISGMMIDLPSTWGEIVSIGLTFGMLLGFTVILGDEIPQRLRRFWKWWSRAVWAGLFGFVLGTGVWSAYHYLFLALRDLQWNILAYAGIGIAVAFILMNLFRLPSVLSFIVTALGLYVPLYWAWNQYWTVDQSQSAIIYFYEDQQVFTWLIPIVLIIAFGVNAQALWRDAKWLLRRLRG